MPSPQQLILACIDGSTVSDIVCDYAHWLSGKTELPLKLLHTIEHASEAATMDYSGAIGLGSREDLLKELTEAEQNRSRRLIQQGQSMLQDAKQHVLDAGGDSPELCQRHGSLSESLIELEDKIDVLVLGLHGESHEKIQQGVGAQLETVIRSLHRPILVVNKAFTTPKKIMLAYDGSPACLKALAMITTSRALTNTHCHVVHVGEKGEAFIEDAVHKLEKAGIQASGIQLVGKAVETLAQYQVDNNIDLMAMGAFGHNRFRELLLGSFTAKMLAKTEKPLLLLR